MTSFISESQISDQPEELHTHLPHLSHLPHLVSPASPGDVPHSAQLNQNQSQTKADKDLLFSADLHKNKQRESLFYPKLQTNRHLNQT